MYWVSDYNVVRRVLVFTGILLFIWLLVLLLHHGLRLGFGSTIGGINRNTTSTVGLGALSCCALSTKKAIRMAERCLPLVFCRRRHFARVACWRLFVFIRRLLRALQRNEQSRHPCCSGRLPAVAVLMVSSLDARHHPGENPPHCTPKTWNRQRFYGTMGAVETRLRCVLGKPYNRARFPRRGAAKVHSGYIKLLEETGLSARR